MRRDGGDTPVIEASRLRSRRKLLAGPIHGHQLEAQVFPEAPALPGCVTSDKVPSAPSLGPFTYTPRLTIVPTLRAIWRPRERYASSGHVKCEFLTSLNFALLLVSGDVLGALLRRVGFTGQIEYWQLHGRTT
uniref:Uncharacterized protein n=1 Tax=Myotis myotis TaxID=51298 RepID=A0A7J7XI86_MYOMY|nr:hypothetical protein mMyoMyo1_011607 [Myotis myotis]